MATEYTMVQADLFGMCNNKRVNIFDHTLLYEHIGCQQYYCQKSTISADEKHLMATKTPRDSMSDVTMERVSTTSCQQHA